MRFLLLLNMRETYPICQLPWRTVHLLTALVHFSTRTIAYSLVTETLQVSLKKLQPFFPSGHQSVLQEIKGILALF